MFKKYRLIVAILVIGLLSGGGLHTVDASASMGGNSEKGNSNTTQNDREQAHYDDLEKFFNYFFSKSQKSNKYFNKRPVEVAPTPVEPQTPEQPEATPEVPEQPEATPEQPNQEVEEDQAPNEDQSNQASELNQFEQEVFNLTNVERTNNGLPAFEIHLDLSKVAREKSNDISINNYFAHNSPVYGSPFDMMRSFGIDYRTAGENIAQGQRTPAEVVNAWMNSPGHRANILNGDFTHIGVGYVESGNVWTQQFIGK